MRLRPILIAGAGSGVLILTLLFGIGLFNSAQVGNRPAIGAVPPDFELTLYPNYQADLGERVKLSDLRGKVVLLNFWASWCIPCRDEAPALEAMWREYRDRGVVFLGVDYLDTEADGLRFLAEFGTTYANGFDVQQRISRQYRITGVPETFVIDQQGVVRTIFIQPINETRIRAAIDPLLNEVAQ